MADEDTLSEDSVFLREDAEDAPHDQCINSLKKVADGEDSRSYQIIYNEEEQTSTLEEDKTVEGVSVISQYYGDYERDAHYMKLTETRVNDECSSSVVEKSQDFTHGTKTSSLPDMCYQSLQPLTRDPHSEYESLHKEKLLKSV